jgi:hypothetical protein
LDVLSIEIKIIVSASTEMEKPGYKLLKLIHRLIAARFKQMEILPNGKIPGKTT